MLPCDFAKEVSQDFFASAKSFIEKIGRQVRVHNNVEAIVLNGNMFRNMSSKNNTQIFDSTMWSCSFLRAISGRPRRLAVWRISLKAELSCFQSKPSMKMMR